MKIIYSILIALLIVGCAENKKSADNNDGTYLMLKKEYTFNADGSYTLTYTHKLQYNSYFAFHRLAGETFIIYNPDFQTLKINKSETTMADGKRIVGPANALNEVLPSWAARSGAYNHMREMVVTHTGLEIGAVVELSYTIETKKPSLGYVAIYEPLQYNLPINDLEIIFNVPSSTPFSILETDKTQLSERNGIKTYKYKMTDISPTDKGNHFHNSFVPHMIAQTGEKTMSQLLHEIDPGKATLQSIDDKNFEIALMVQAEMMNVKNIHIPAEYQIFPVQNAETTKNRNSGSALEKTILFQNLLQEKGIESKIAFQIPERDFNENIATFNAISDFYLLLNVNNQPIALSAIEIHEKNPIYEQGFVCVAKSETGIERFSLQKELFVSTDAEITIEKTKQGASITTLETINGSKAMFGEIRKMGDKPKSNDITTTINTKLNSFDSNDTATVVKLKGFSNKETLENILQLDLPTNKIGIDSWHLTTLSETYNTSIQLPAKLTEESTIRIKLPEGAKPIVKPMNSVENSPFGEVELSIEIMGNEIIVKRKIQIRTSVIQPKEYSSFVKMMQLWESTTFRNLYIEL